MIQRRYITLLFLIALLGAEAQVPFYKIHTLGFHQTTAGELKEVKGKIYIAGMALDTSIRPTERNLHLTAFNLDGEPLKTFYWDNPNVVDDEMSMQWSNFHVYEDQFVIPYDGLGVNCTISVDTVLVEASILGCYTKEEEPRIASVFSSTIWNEDDLVVLSGGLIRRNYFTKLDLNDQSEISLYDVSPDSIYLYSTISVFETDDGHLTIFGIDGRLGADRADHEFGLTRTVVDSDYKVVSTDRFGIGIVQNVSSSDWLIDATGNYVALGTRYDTVQYVETGRRFSYPVIVKFDSETLDIIWETPLDGSDYRDYYPYFVSLTETQDKDGYIAVGNAYADSDNGGPSRLIYAKIDTDGTVSWLKEHRDDYEGDGTELRIQDVIATSDGYYMACGDRSDLSPNDGIDSRVQVFLVKFDEDGNLLNTSATAQPALHPDLKVYPNPADDLVRITSSDQLPIKVRLTDMNGRLIMEQDACQGDCTLDVSGLASGSYVVLISSDSDTFLYQKIIMVE